MQTLLSLLQAQFKDALLSAFPKLGSEEGEILCEITPSTQERFGHYQFNSAMKLAKTLALPPRKIAEAVVAALPTNNPIIARLDIAGPGFVNIALDPEELSKRLDQLLRDPYLGIERASHKQRIIIDFSSPNVAKEMHVGHLRSTIIGDCLARLFEFLGYDVLRLNHIGDWGTAFGMLIAYMQEEAPAVLKGQIETNLGHLVDWYRAAKQKFDDDASFKKRAHQAVVDLQRGQMEALDAWGIICTISRKAYQEIYDVLDVHLIERGESFYNPYLADLVKDLENKMLITLSDGAKCLFLEGFQNREGAPLPLMVQKSDGGYNYDTTDMAAIHHRTQVEKANRIIYVTDAGQSTHFQMIFKAAEKAGYVDPKKVRLDHVPFGLVLGADGKKFRTRSGETEKLIDLLQAAVTQADAILVERNPNMDPEERGQLAKTLGIGAVKYADLSNHRLSDYTFSYEKMLRFEGNTAAFLMYAFVRIEGIKRKVKADLPSLLQRDQIALKHPSEVDLGMHLLRFQEVIEWVAQELLPNRLTDYLFTLAEKFNAFFRDCRVEGVEEEGQRVLLCEAAGRVLKQGLLLLGLKTVDRM